MSFNLKKRYTRYTLSVCNRTKYKYKTDVRTNTIDQDLNYFTSSVTTINRLSLTYSTTFDNYNSRDDKRKKRISTGHDVNVVLVGDHDMFLSVVW